MNRPRLSIGMPVYNGAPFLGEGIEAYLGQTFGDFELIISDNGSTDGTWETAQTYATADRRVRVFRNERNLGLAQNHNIVFHHAVGEFFKWAPSDDICLPTYLQRCVKVLDSRPDVVLTYPKTRFVNPAKEPLNLEDPGWNLPFEEAHERLRRCIYWGHFANAVIGLIRREAMSKTRLMPVYPGGDFRILAELSVMGKFYEIPEYLFLRRLHPRSSNQNASNPGWMAEYWTGVPWANCTPFWSLSFDQLRIILGAPFTLSQKCSLLKSLAKSLYWGNQRLRKEFSAALRWQFARLSAGMYKSASHAGR